MTSCMWFVGCKTRHQTGLRPPLPESQLYHSETMGIY